VAAVVLELHYGTGQTGPASAESIKAYQAMMNRDHAQQDTPRHAYADYCSTLESICPAPGRPTLAALQRWLDDLNGSTPPARFAIIDAEVRRHLKANISELNAMVAAYQARNQEGSDRAYNAAFFQSYWFDAVTSGIVSSQSVTAADYIDSVRIMQQTLGACGSCQALGSTSRVDCPSLETPTCPERRQARDVRV